MCCLNVGSFLTSFLFKVFEVFGVGSGQINDQTSNRNQNLQSTADLLFDYLHTIQFDSISFLDWIRSHFKMYDRCQIHF